MADEKEPVKAPEAPKPAAPAKVEPVAPGNFSFSGSVGLPFAIYGNDLGDSGTLTIGGEKVVPMRWQNTNIKGTVPVDVKPGKVKVVVNGKSIDATV